jgi:hypothetical protein
MKVRQSEPAINALPSSSGVAAAVATVCSVGSGNITFGFFYLFEQAIMHGHNSKKLADKVAASVNVNTNK